MKSLKVPIISIVIGLFLSGPSFAGEKVSPVPPALLSKVSSVLAPLSNERIAILTGEKALTGIGLKDGIIKGDIGLIAADQDEAARDSFIGRCAVVKTGLSSSVCELITQKKEIVGGDKIFFDRISYSDANIYQMAIAMLTDLVEPYEPYKQLKVMVYGIFDQRNNVTGLSDRLKGEITNTFSQKKRIHVVDSREFKEFVFYPGASPDVLEFARTKMKKSGADVLLLGKYLADGQNITLTMSELSTDNPTKTWRFSFPQAKYAELVSQTILSAQEETQIHDYPCSIFVKSHTEKFDKANERADMVRQEADGNAFVELGLKRSDFNIVSPVDIKVTLDDTIVLQGVTSALTIPISPGAHRLVASFRRGYYFDESLVYTSQREVAKEIGLDLHRIKNLSISIDLDPRIDGNAIGLRVVEHAGKEKQTIEPVPRVESDKTVEVFRD